MTQALWNYFAVALQQKGGGQNPDLLSFPFIFIRHSLRLNI
jgi:hypothetical protein